MNFPISGSFLTSPREFFRLMRLSENVHLPFDKLMVLSKVEGLRYPPPSSLRRTSMYASFLGICPRFAWTPHPAGGSPVSEALHLGIFHQPPRRRFFDSLYWFLCLLFTAKTQRSLRLSLFLLSVFSLEPWSLSELYSHELKTKRHFERNDCYATKAMEADR
jgi:hypothetical protein